MQTPVTVGAAVAKREDAIRPKQSKPVFSHQPSTLMLGDAERLGQRQLLDASRPHHQSEWNSGAILKENIMPSSSARCLRGSLNRVTDIENSHTWLNFFHCFASQHFNVSLSEQARGVLWDCKENIRDLNARSYTIYQQHLAIGRESGREKVCQ